MRLAARIPHDHYRDVMSLLVSDRPTDSGEGVSEHYVPAKQRDKLNVCR